MRSAWLGGFYEKMSHSSFWLIHAAIAAAGVALIALVGPPAHPRAGRRRGRRGPMTASPRIAIAGFQHESSSFSPFGATYDDFVAADGWPAMTLGADIIELFPTLNVPDRRLHRDRIVRPRAHRLGERRAVRPGVGRRLRGHRRPDLPRIAEAGPLDGIYLDLHGAMITVSHEDGEASCCAGSATSSATTCPSSSASTCTPTSPRRWSAWPTP
ncbi:MAG: M81 family metallopeptidase [Caulobacteraceae bacterium]